MQAIGVIPARWASTRFPGKVLANLAGKPMIQHVWQQAKKAGSLDKVIIACDDEKVLQTCQHFGAEVVMTSPDHQSGTDRIAEAVANIESDIVVNIQGDEPLISPSAIDCLVNALADNSSVPMATLIQKIEDEEDVENPNIVKAVVDQQGFALYFSRHSIPYNRDRKLFEDITFYKHFGLYAYKRDFVLSFNQLPSSQLEQIEKLEQLRVLEAGYRILTVQTGQESIGVDCPEDLERVAALLGE